MILSLLILFAAQTATAPAAPAPKGWVEVNQRLRDAGLKPEQADWQNVNATCFAQAGDRTSGAYTQCQADLARDQLQFSADKSRCDERARNTPRITPPNGVALYDALTRQPTGTPAQQYEQTRKQQMALHHIASGTPTALGPEEAYQSCMQQSGWRDPNNWKAGR